MSTQDPFKSQSTFLRAVPVMTVNDLDRSLTVFTQLGFQIHHQEAGFAIVKRDATEVHFTHHPEMRPEENNSVCRIVVSHIEALYQEILVIQTLHPHLFSRTPHLTTQRWGDREINLVDPYGILLMACVGGWPLGCRLVALVWLSRGCNGRAHRPSCLWLLAFR